MEELFAGTTRLSTTTTTASPALPHTMTTAMDTLAQQPHHIAEPAYAILRIKRRRDEEPLDALVVESKSRRKKTKGGPGVFQYVQTVEDTVWNSEKAQKELLEEKIPRLAREKTLHADWKAQAPDRRSPLLNRNDRRYTIIETDPPLSPQKSSPPVVSASQNNDTQQPCSDFKMYDAVLATPAETPDLDPEMEKFQSMLSDYLKLNEVDVRPQTQQPNLMVDSAMKSPDTEGDYVWDVFYHRPATLAEWNEIANVGTLSGFPAPNTDSYSSDSDQSEEEDEADEDSNDEDYYKNDYPDEEDDSGASSMSRFSLQR
ncbi:hypothetical protein CC2G_012953 [Coprinopsis cinerea AmutBmut pab1-1]|nr:hypothetical protein CC2G_012953 [Coprinopsis cinerea AmutBmut pab1-1]